MIHFSRPDQTFFFSSAKKYFCIPNIFLFFLLRFSSPSKTNNFILQIFSSFSFSVFLLLCRKKYTFLFQIFSSFLFSSFFRDIECELPILPVILLFCPISLINSRTFLAQFGLVLSKTDKPSERGILGSDYLFIGIREPTEGQQIFRTHWK